MQARITGSELRALVGVNRNVIVSKMDNRVRIKVYKEMNNRYDMMDEYAKIINEYSCVRIVRETLTIMPNCPIDLELEKSNVNV